MKKNIIYIIALLCLVQPICADLKDFCQTYVEGSCGYVPGEGKQVLCFGEEVMLDGKLYYPAGDDRFVRKADEHIYLRINNQPDELVLYDFSLQVGDTVPFVYYYYNPELEKPVYTNNFPKDKVEEWQLSIYPNDTVISVYELTLLNGERRKALDVGRGTDFHTIVEGLGALNQYFFNSIKPQDVPTCGVWRLLICSSANGELLYKVSDEKIEEMEVPCACGSSYDAVEDIQTISSLVSPNPAQGYIDLQLPEVSQVAVYSATGSCVMQCADTHLDIVHLPAGIYLLQATDPAGKQYQGKFVKE